ncbi:Phosphatases II [Mycena venus]|uniref:protein-tyrosine-phosphatase n=1 Tax=Mycena venus TaxID=2733690 RepID=A0A8H6XGD5_9AGAR|nr:Phosphatases II [Mycena venus]
MGKRDKASKSATSLVFPSIYLGPCSAASSISFLTTNSITHVLSVGVKLKNPVDGVVYHYIALEDKTSVWIFEACKEARKFINEALSSRNGTGKILVHCKAGISRSPTIVTEYLMRRHRMSLKAALGQIVRVRPQVVPNTGFLAQLRDLDMELFGCVSLEVAVLPSREQDRLALFEVEEKAVALVAE